MAHSFHKKVIMKKILSSYIVMFFCLHMLFVTESHSKQSLLMATTTSTEDSGLLDVLGPLFTKETGIDIKWVAVGTGKALAHGKNCDVDVLLVHAPDAELAFIEAGHGMHRQLVMYNDFVLVGPKEDTAKVRGNNASVALKAIATSTAPFVSRGDDSGTHKAEQKLWKQLYGSIPQKEKWYISVGQGMMSTLNIASEKKAYALTDRGTWINFSSKKPDSELTILVEGDKALFNQYSVLEIHPKQCPKVKSDLAAKFAAWLISPSTQAQIAKYTVQDKQLFFPNARTDAQ